MCLSRILLLIGSKEIGLNCALSIVPTTFRDRRDPSTLPFFKNTTRSEREIKDTSDCKCTTISS